MQWLNNIDDALDRRLDSLHPSVRPASRPGRKAERQRSGENTSEILTKDNPPRTQPLHHELSDSRTSTSNAGNASWRSSGREQAQWQSSHFENSEFPSSAAPPLAPETSLLENPNQQLENESKARNVATKPSGEAKAPKSSFWINATTSSTHDTVHADPEQSSSNPIPVKDIHFESSISDDVDFTEFSSPAVPIPWFDPSVEATKTPIPNCHGVVHVRLLRAKHLPCPAGSKVQAVLSLPPWQGKVRSETTEALQGPPNLGVCVRWDPLSEGGLFSMVNAWNNADSPVPSIRIELCFSPFGMGVMVLTMFKVNLFCHPIIQNPSVWRTQWCVASELVHEGHHHQSHEKPPEIYVEAMFEPTQERPSDQIDESTSEIGDMIDEGEVSSKGGKTLPPSAPSLASSKINLSAPHLLRASNAWVPVVCAACARMVFGRRKMFLCERCGVGICGDCRLNIDIRLPCGSPEAKEAVEKGTRTKLSLEKIMNIVAPVDERIAETLILNTTPKTIEEKRRGIGTFRCKIVAAALFSESFSAEASLNDDLMRNRSLRVGDYYARLSVSGSKETQRTKTYQNTGSPLFFEEVMEVDADHYGVEYTISIRDSESDEAVGTLSLTTQELILAQRDIHSERHGVSLLQVADGPFRSSEMRKVKYPLRRKHTFVTPDLSHPSSSQLKDGEIVGWVEAFVGFEENVRELFNRKSPMDCPDRPPENLDVSKFQHHISRLESLIDDIKSIFAIYAFVVSWKNPTVTSLSFIGFVLFCLKFNMEYVGSLPFFFALLWLVYTAFSKSETSSRDRIVRKAVALSQEEAAVRVKRTIHRPIGTLEVSVKAGKNLWSRDYGLPGKVLCTVCWDPSRGHVVESASTKKAARFSHQIGTTEAHFTANPVWGRMLYTRETMRLLQLLPANNTPFEADEMHQGLQMKLDFPLLQPLGSDAPSEEQLGNEVAMPLAPWESLRGALVFRISFKDLINTLPGFDDQIGEVVVPIQNLLRNGEIKGWFIVSEESSILAHLSDQAVELADEEVPRIFVFVKWNPPAASTTSSVEREASRAIEEEMIRSALVRRQATHDIVGSSIGALNTAIGLAGTVQGLQNILGRVADILEILRNAMNFTNPFLSSIIFLTFLALWLVLVIVPTRALLLLAGIGQYAYTLSTAIAKPRNKRQDLVGNSSDEDDDENDSEVVTWVLNAFRSLPTDEDIRKAYGWEAWRLASEHTKRATEEHRKSRLECLWQVPWYNIVRIRCRSAGRDTSGRWHNVFALLKGHRFLWWDRIEDFDAAEPPAGKLFLSGHYGLTTPSPLESRSLSSDELARAVGIFGRGATGQERVILIAPTPDDKRKLEALIEGTPEKDD